MKIINNLEQRSPAWHEFRRNHVMATCSGVILGLNNKKTPYQLWLEKLGYETQLEPTPLMMRGITLEPHARELFEELTETKVFPVVVESEENSFIAASLDGLSEDKKTLVEIKVSTDTVHEQAKVGIYQPRYIAQIQHQIYVTELDKATYFSFNGLEGVPITIYRDDKFIKDMIEKEKEFWEHVQNFEAPSLSNKDYTEINSETFDKLSKEYLRIKHNKEILSMKEAELRDELIAYCRNGNVKNNIISIQKIPSKGRIEYKKIPALSEVNLEQFRSPATSSWRILSI